MRDTNLEQQIRQYRDTHVRVKLWQRFVAMLGCISIFCTTYAMVLPAITMTNSDMVNCGMLEHKHTDECYEERTELRYACEEALHRHTADCYNEWGECVCGYADYYIHTHDEACYDEEGKLVCTLPEVAEHIHDEGCFGTEELCVCGLEATEGHTHGDGCWSEERLLICGESDDPAHTHTEECYARSLICEEAEGHTHGDECYESALVCEEADPGHEHTEECYARVLICEEAEGHAHTDECYDTVLTCGESAEPLHTHTDECYETARTLICGQEERAAHEHTDECRETRTVVTCSCEQPEYSGDVTEAAFHAHTAECFNEAGELICGHVEILRHQHDNCTYEATEKVLTCPLPEHEHDMGCFPLNADEASKDLLCGYRYEHLHNEECYNDGVLVCSLTEHMHTAACLPPDTAADLEDSGDWEASVADLTLTTNWASDTVLVAESQLGCAESERNYEMQDNGVLKGVSRYGQWFGYPYADWDAMFVSFCLSYAGVDYAAVPQEADAARWANLLRDAGYDLWRDAGSYDPKPGDLVFFDYDGAAQAGPAAYIPAEAEEIPAEAEEIPAEAEEIPAETEEIPAEAEEIPAEAEEIPAEAEEIPAEAEEIPVEAEEIPAEAEEIPAEAEEIPAEAEEAPVEAEEVTAEVTATSEARPAVPEYTAPAERAADHVGIVYDILPATEVSGGMLYVIEGDRDDMVCIAMYDLDAPSILGYCEMPENPKEVKPEPKREEKTLTVVASDGTEVVVSGLLPVGITLSVEPVELSEEELAAMVGEEQAAAMLGIRFYDICLLDPDGKEWEPDSKVHVVIRQSDFSVAEDESVSVVHISDEGDVEHLPATMTEEQEIVFETGAFSLYGVDSTGHLWTSQNANISNRTSYLYNIDYSGDGMAPLAGVTYTVYTTSGTVVGTATTTTDYPLSLEELTAPDGVSTVKLVNGTTYKVAQTAVPAGYIAVPQTTTFTMTSAGAAVGMFFDYLADAFSPDKTAEVVDYDARTYGVTISSVSGKYDCTPTTMDITLVVDRSGSMFFPADLVPTGKKVKIYNNNGDQNTKNLTAALGTDSDELYYLIADDQGTATVYAVWYNKSEKVWYYQDASNYSKAQMNHMDGVQFAKNEGWSGSTYGGVFNKSIKDRMNDDINSSRGKTDSYGHYFEYEIYTGSEYNRLTYLKDSVNQLISQLVSLKSPEDTINISLVTFCSSPTGEGSYSLSSDTAISNLRSKLNNIATSGGTRHDLALKYVLDNKSTYAKTGGTIILISDGAITDKSSTAYNNLKSYANSLKANSRLITVGLSLGNVTAGKTLLSDVASEENGKPLAYNVEYTSDLSRLMLEEVLSRIVRKDKETMNATIRDYISNSFYPIDPDTNAPLEDGTLLGADGKPCGTNDVKPYLVDSAGTKLKAGDWVSRYGVKTTSSDSSRGGQVNSDGLTITWSKWKSYWGNTPTLNTVTPSYGTLHYDQSAGQWYVEWSRQTLPLKENGTWKGKVFIKAKEDFIGGNAIDTNGDAWLRMEDDTVEDGLEPYELESPTVNVHLLQMNSRSSKETVYLGDAADPAARLKELFSRLEFTKLVSGTGSVLNRSGKTSGDGCYAGTFSLAYAMAKTGNKLSDTDWATLLGGGTLTVPYIYDAASSQGNAVGSFEIKLAKSTDVGATLSYSSHATTKAGDPAEVYDLLVTYTPYKLGETKNGTLLRPSANVHNGTNGPGTKVLNTSPLKSKNEHEVIVIDGEITVYKYIDKSLEGKTDDLEVTFKLQRWSSTAEDYVDYPNSTAPYTQSVDLPGAADTPSAAAVFEHLPRGDYRVIEIGDPEEYLLKTIRIVTDGTNCYSSVSDPETPGALFRLGVNKSGSDVIRTLTPTSTENPIVYSAKTENAGTLGKADFVNKAPEYKGDLPVLKNWVGGGTHTGDAVYLLLCDIDGNVVEKDEKAQLLKLNAGNSWSGKFVVTLPEKDSDPLTLYTVREVTGVTDTNTGALPDAVIVNDDDTAVYYVEAVGEEQWITVGGASYVVHYGVSSDGETITVMNRIGGELPATGGSGLGRMFGVGVGLMGASLLGAVTALTVSLHRLRKKENEQ